jgi:hypothetical protein
MSAVSALHKATYPLRRGAPPDKSQQTIAALMEAHPREAAIHKAILTKRGTGVAAAWQKFEQFLADLGPAPDETHELRFVYADSFSYGPGLVEWVKCDAPKTFKPRPPPPTEAYSQWAQVNGKSVSYSDFVRSTGGTFKELAPVLNAQVTPDQILDQKAVAEKNIRQDASWLPPQPERRDAFLAAYRLWHMQVLPKFAEAATPEFLFLFIAVGQLMKARDELDAIGLFSRTSNAKKQQREDQPAWKRYCELLPKAQAALATIPTYNSYSLFNELEELHPRITVAEQRFRGVTAKPPVR